MASLFPSPFVHLSSPWAHCWVRDERGTPLAKSINNSHVGYACMSLTSKFHHVPAPPSLPLGNEKAGHTFSVNPETHIQRVLAYHCPFLHFCVFASFETSTTDTLVHKAHPTVSCGPWAPLLSFWGPPAPSHSLISSHFSESLSRRSPCPKGLP